MSRARGRGEIGAPIFGHVALRFEQIALGAYLVEGQQDDIVGQVVRVGHGADGVVVDGIGPECVEACVGVGGRLHNPRGEGRALATRFAKVAIHIAEGIDAITARCHTFDAKASCAIGAGHAVEGAGREGRVGRIAVESDKDALDGFKVARCQHAARDLHSVQLVACGEVVGEIAQGVALRGVGDGVGEVDGVGCVGQERVHEGHRNFLAQDLYFGHFDLGWRDGDFLAGLFHFDKFVKGYRHSVGATIGLSDGRRHGNNARRCFVVGTTVGPAARIGAGECDEEREKEGKNLSHKCLVNGVLSARAGSRVGAGNA